LEEVGLSGERVAMLNFSSAMGTQFAESMQETAKRLKELGPNPLGDMEGLHDCC
jgi:coenzyme F420-reducing hydrogenase delta subunit